jgi:hypothetical protein
MRPSTLAVLALALLALAVRADHREAVPTQQALTYDLDRMSMTEALTIRGRRATFRLVLDSLPDEHEGMTLYDAVAVDSAYGSVFLAPGQVVREGEEAITVQATLRVLFHAGGVIDETYFPPLTEFRLVDALRVD